MVDLDLLCLTSQIEWTSTEDKLPGPGMVLFWVLDESYNNRAGGYIGWYSGLQGGWFDVYGRPIYANVAYWTAFPKGPDCTLGIGMDYKDD